MRTAQQEATAYDWRADALASYLEACRLIAISIGSRPWKTLPEMYWVEQHGGIP